MDQRISNDIPADAPDKWTWMLNRLRCMSPSEIGYRLTQRAVIQWERLTIGLPREIPAPDLSKESAFWVGSGRGMPPGPYVDAAERVLAGRYDVFAMKDVELGDPPAWNRNPKTGIEAPLAFGKTLDYRETGLSGQVGSIKYLWEPNRHLHLVTLAQAYNFTDDIRYLAAIRRHLESWFEACPYPYGANWSTAFEPAIRLIHWSIAWQLIGGNRSQLFASADGSTFRMRWLEMVYLHAEFISGHFSCYSSANNHLIGEAAGVFVAAVTWPCWTQAQKWERIARSILGREAQLQNTPDGVNREQAVCYQQFVIDLLLVCGLAARASGADFSPEYWRRIESMLEFLASIADVAGNLPMIGDSDDGRVAQFSQESGFNQCRSLLATGAVLFHRSDFRAKAGRLDDRTRWLLGDDAQQAFDRLPAGQMRLPVRTAFREGGYFVLGTDFETADEVRIVADAGPLGYLSIAAHGHADALAFTLSVGGWEFLVDSGTFAYHTQRQWRDYFRGTSAHNTLRIDGLDQSVIGGNFMWLRKADARCDAWHSDAVIDALEARHDGYQRLADPVIHRRTLRFDKPARRLQVEDALECAGGHGVEMFWHFSEQCEVALAGNEVMARNGLRSIRMQLPAQGNAAIFCGSLEPIAGWISRRFDEKTPAPTVIWTTRIGGTARFMTEIDF
ncbi:MAG TPA: alginate lyase family protein [Burkholderiales bacterium]|nr:alginate lyase family protein [Burkholderiales bacterium]